MRQDLEEKLMQDFPWMEAKHIWTGKKLDFPTPCECEDGWFNIIYNCCKEIDDLYKSKNANINDLIIYQVKEKYGELCFYVGNYIDGVQEIIDKYEEESAKTCEVCGKYGSTVHKGSWLKTLCNKHTKELGYKQFKEFEKNA